MAEKGFGTRVEIRADDGLRPRGADLERLLDDSPSRGSSPSNSPSRSECPLEEAPVAVATVISCIALFVALSGAAYAATLGKNAVKTKNIANGAVTAAETRRTRASPRRRSPTAR